MTNKNNAPIITYLLLGTCLILVVFGVYQMVTERFEDGIINLIIGTSLLGTNIDIDLKKAPLWQKTLIYLYGAGIVAGSIYIATIIFNR